MLDQLFMMGDILRKSYLISLRLPVFQALKAKLEGQDVYCIVYLNQQSDCNPIDAEAIYTINPQTKFPTTCPYDLVLSDLSGTLFLDKKNAEGFRQGNTKILHATELLDKIIKVQGDLLERTKKVIGVDVWEQKCKSLQDMKVFDLSKPF